MNKILSCITNKIFLNADDDYNKLYILAVINNNDITWHIVDKKNTNREQIITIYNYFKKKYNKKKVNIQHYNDVEILYDNILKLTSPNSNALFLKVFFE
jgi:hypothetical protein